MMIILKKTVDDFKFIATLVIIFTAIKIIVTTAQGKAIQWIAIINLTITEFFGTLLFFFVINIIQYFIDYKKLRK